MAHHNVSPEYWQCRECKITIPVEFIIEAFREAQEKVERELNVSIMAYAVDWREIRIDVQSNKFIGQSRNESVQRSFSQGMKDSIEDVLVEEIERILNIDVADMRDLFQT